MSTVLINDEYLHDIADSIRKKKLTSNPITTDSMAGEIDGIDIGWNTQDKWQRPIDWPDYSQISLTNFEGMYYTYDTTAQNGWCGLQATVTGGYRVERGQIEDGEFVVEKTTNVNSGANYIEMLPYTISGYVVYRITAQNTNNAITRVGQVPLTAAASGNGMTDLYWNQPVVERYGRLPRATTFYQWTNTNVISDTIRDMAAMTSLNSAWNTAYQIENIDLTGFSARPTSCYYTFRNCYSLRYVTTANLVTSACTSMASMFYGAVNVQYVDTTGWDTSKVTTFASLFEGCQNLYKVDTTCFDTSSATTISSMFYNCFKLREIDVTGFNTSKVTSMANLFRGCTRVESLDVSGFDTSLVTSMTYMFQACYSLKSLDPSGFSTGNVTTMSYMFANLRNVRSLDLHAYNVKKVTDASYMFSGCTGLESLDVSGWELDAVTTVRNMFDSSFSLKNLNMTGMTVADTLSASNCFAAVFSNMYKVKKLDLSGWDLSNLPASYASVFRYDYQVEEVIMPASFKAMAATFLGNCQSLRVLVLPSTTLVTLANTNAFGTTPSTKVIYVPDALVETYRTATNWSSLTCTFAPLSTYIGGNG